MNMMNDRAAFEAFLQTVPTMSVEKRVKLYIKTRDAKAAAKRAHDAQAADFDKIMDLCQNSMLKEADSQGVAGFRTTYGTTYAAETAQFSIADGAVFYAFVMQAADLDFFERRVSSKHVQLYMEQNGGALPPGLNIFRERVMRVRKG